MGDIVQRKPKSSRLDSSYQYNSVGVETGKSIALNDDLVISGSLNMVRAGGKASISAGKSNMSSLAYGGTIQAEYRTDNVWLRGRAALTQYSFGMSTKQDGTLVGGRKVMGYSLGLEVGTHHESSYFEKDLILSPKAWLHTSQVNKVSFTDSTNTRLAITDGSVITAGAGVTVKTAEAQGKASPTLGFVGLEAAIDGKTAMQINGSNYASKDRGMRAFFGLSSRRALGNGKILDWSVRADYAGSGNTAINGSLRYSF